MEHTNLRILGWLSRAWMVAVGGNFQKCWEGKCNDTGASRFFFVIIAFILTKCLRIVSIQDHLMDAYLGVHGVGNWVIGLVWGSVNRRVVVGWSRGRLLGWW